MKIRGWVLYYEGVWFVQLWRFGNGFCGTEVFGGYLYEDLEMGFVTQRCFECTCMVVWEGFCGM